MSEVLLIQPNIGIHDFIATRFPDPLLAIASIPHQRGYKVKLLDQRVEKNFKQLLEQEIRKKPLCVALPVMTGGQILRALEISKFIKSIDKDVKIIWGGPHPTLFPAQVLENENIDIVVSGEGEITFFELVEALSKGMPLSGIKGLSYKENGAIKTNPERDLIKNLDDLPPIPYDLVDTKKYNPTYISGRKAFTLLTSRGCPYRCTFCFATAYYNFSWRGYSVDRTMEMIHNAVDKFGAQTILFQEDNFATSIPRCNEIFDRIIKDGLDITFSLVGIRATDVIRMDLDKMYKAGCRNCDMGVESADPEVMKTMIKALTPQLVLDVNKKIADYDIKVKYSFIAGLPMEKDPRISIDFAFKLIKENKNAYTPFFPYTPFPGTEMYHLAIEKGFVPPTTLEGWGNFDLEHWRDHYPNWYTEEEKRWIEGIERMSVLGNRNSKYKISNKTFRFLFDLYHPIAKFRFMKNYYGMPLDIKMQNKVMNIVVKTLD